MVFDLLLYTFVNILNILAMGLRVRFIPVKPILTNRCMVPRELRMDKDLLTGVIVYHSF